MDAAGVDVAMVCSLAQRIENDFIIGLENAHPERLFGFGQVMPQADDALDEIRRMRRRRPWAEAAPQHARLPRRRPRSARPDLPALRRVGMPVLINALDDAFCAPFAIEEIAKDHPDVPTIIAHMGAVWNVPEAIIVAERHTTSTSRRPRR